MAQPAVDLPSAAPPPVAAGFAFRLQAGLADEIILGLITGACVAAAWASLSIYPEATWLTVACLLAAVPRASRSAPTTWRMPAGRPGRPGWA
jgi:hypothetical protein